MLCCAQIAKDANVIAICGLHSQIARVIVCLHQPKGVKGSDYVGCSPSKIAKEKRLRVIVLTENPDCMK